jgi:hypothetical protein
VNSEFETAHAETFTVNEVPAPYHAQRAARRIRLVVRGENLVYPLLICVRWKRGKADEEYTQRSQGCESHPKLLSP